MWDAIIDPALREFARNMPVADQQAIAVAVLAITGYTEQCIAYEYNRLLIDKNEDIILYDIIFSDNSMRIVINEKRCAEYKYLSILDFTTPLTIKNGINIRYYTRHALLEYSKWRAWAKDRIDCRVKA